MNYILLAIVASILCFSILPFAVAEHPGHIHFHGGVSASGQHFVRGDVIQFNGWSNAYKDWEGGLILTPGAIFDVRIQDPDGKIIFRQNFTADDNGEIRFSLPVTKDFKFGKYLVHFSISKEGYENYTEEHDLNRFYVIRTQNDALPAKEYNFEIWSEESEVKFGSNVIIHGKISPSPLDVLANEEFVDPVTGIVVDPLRLILHFHFIRPDGSVAQDYGICGLPDCDTNKLRGQFYANKVGQWSVYATMRWVSEGFLYEAKSNSVNVLVKPSLFQGNEPEKISVEKIEAVSGLDNYPQPARLQFELLDWSSDGKFILFSYFDYSKAASEFAEGTEFGMMSPDGMHIEKIEIPVQFKNGFGARLSPSDDSILLFAKYDQEDRYQVFRYDMTEQKLVQLSNNDPFSNVNSFDWMPDGNIVFGEEVYNQKSDYIAYNLWLLDSNGKRITKLYGWSFDPDIRYSEEFDGRPRFYGFDISPDGEKIVLISYKVTGMFQTYYNLPVFDIEKKEFKNVPNPSSPIESPRWSPNGEFIIYDVGTGYKTPGGWLQITNVDGTLHEALSAGAESPGDDPTTFVVSPDGESILIGIDPWVSQGTASKLFRMEFMQPIPEFLIALIVLATSLIVFVIASQFYHRQ